MYVFRSFLVTDVFFWSAVKCDPAKNNQASEEESAPWELLYNLGTALVQRGEEAGVATAEECLARVEETCRQV